ncbi:MAG: hypothetical protein IJT87_07595 [Ruminiclostridium sp.]|nr:hypothetical protein [Ruminiclostridium sp.]
MSTLYDIIDILPIPLLSVILFGKYAGMPEGSIAGFLISLIFSLWIIILRNMTRKNRLRVIGAVSVFLAGLLLAVGEENRLNFLEEYLWAIWVICISAAALAVGVLMSRNIRIRRIAAAAPPIYCAVMTVLGREISKEAFALICFILLVRLAEEIQRRWRKSGDTDIKGHITRISPALLAVCLAVYLIPAPGEPYDWQLAKDIYNTAASAVNRLYGLIAHPTDDYGSIGFSDSGGFLSGLGGGDEEVLFITAGNTTIRDVRLTGCISGEFTGREWVFDTNTDAEGFSRMTDTLETCCAVRKFAGSSQSDFIQKTNMYYETRFYNTRYIFSPAKIRIEATREKTAGISERNGSIVSAQRLAYNDSYLVSCYVLNYGNPRLEDMLTRAGEISREEWEQAAKAEGVLDETGYTYEDYLRYRSEVYETYCRPCGASGSVKDIIDEIKNSSSSRYEALKKLEAYLGKMEYSTDSGALPGAVTDAAGFLDSFLLDSRKGYCMHFATAFTLMANEMGIPCRYVQGYNVKRDINGNIVVKQSNAHAWPEAYFDNVGWIAFEPTPGYYVPSGWGTRDNTAPEKEEDERETADEPNEADGLSESDENGQPAAPPNPLIFIIPSLAAVCFLLLFYIIGRSLSRKRYEQMGSDDRFRYLTQQSLRYLGYLGFRMESGETLSEFLRRLTASDSEDIGANTGFIPIYERVLYSDRAVSGEDVSLAEKACDNLRKLAKKSSLRSGLLMLMHPNG